MIISDKTAAVDLLASLHASGYTHMFVTGSGWMARHRDDKHRHGTPATVVWDKLGLCHDKHGHCTRTTNVSGVFFIMTDTDTISEFSTLGVSEALRCAGW